jgi:hypothetical protein
MGVFTLKAPVFCVMPFQFEGDAQPQEGGDVISEKHSAKF